MGKGGVTDSIGGRILPGSQSPGLRGSRVGIALTQEASGPPGPPGLSVLAGQTALHSSLWRVVWEIKCLNEWEALDCGGQSGNCSCG